MKASNARAALLLVTGRGEALVLSYVLLKKLLIVLTLQSGADAELLMRTRMSVSGGQKLVLHVINWSPSWLTPHTVP